MKHTTFDVGVEGAIHLHVLVIGETPSVSVGRLSLSSILGIRETVFTRPFSPVFSGGNPSAGGWAAVLPHLGDISLELVEEIIGSAGNNPVAN